MKLLFFFLGSETSECLLLKIFEEDVPEKSVDKSNSFIFFPIMTFVDAFVIDIKQELKRYSTRDEFAFLSRSFEKIW